MDFLKSRFGYTNEPASVLFSPVYSCGKNPKDDAGLMNTGIKACYWYIDGDTGLNCRFPKT